MCGSVRRPGSPHFKGHSYKWLRNHESGTPSCLCAHPSTVYLFIWCAVVSVTAALMGSGPYHLTSWHADGRVHCSAAALPELQRPPSQRSEGAFFKFFFIKGSDISERNLINPLVCFFVFKILLCVGLKDSVRVLCRQRWELKVTPLLFPLSLDLQVCHHRLLHFFTIFCCCLNVLDIFTDDLKGLYCMLFWRNNAHKHQPSLPQRW